MLFVRKITKNCHISYDNYDSFPGSDIFIKNGDINNQQHVLEAITICKDNNYGGFVWINDNFHFRSQNIDELVSNKIKYDNAILCIMQPIDSEIKNMINNMIIAKRLWNSPVIYSDKAIIQDIKMPDFKELIIFNKDKKNRSINNTKKQDNDVINKDMTIKDMIYRNNTKKQKDIVINKDRIDRNNTKKQKDIVINKDRINRNIIKKEEDIIIFKDKK
jgi:hypothetical protein